MGWTRLAARRCAKHGISLKRGLSTAGPFRSDSVVHLVGGRHGLQDFVVVVDGSDLAITDLNGEILIQHARPGRPE